MSRPNNVRGPTSALTEFLRESGITPRTIARRAATRNQPQEQEAPPVAGPSNQVDNNVNNAPEDSGEGGISARTRRMRARVRSRSNLRYSGNASDELDDPEPEVQADVRQAESASAPPRAEGQPAGKKRKLTKAAEAKLKAKEKKKRGIKDSDDDDYTDEDDAYTAPSRPRRGATNGGAGPKPSPGSFENCAKCEQRFTVTVYTMAAVPGPGWLCHPCAKASGNDPFKKPRPVMKKRAPGEKRTVTNFEERRFPSLASMCIQLITKHINDVESLGDIGTMSVEAISKALSRNRSLTPENVQLFYSTTNTTLTLYDATGLPPDAFTTLAYLNPNLTSLRLDFCGQINDSAFDTLSDSLPALTQIELLGPFLVRSASWKKFFTSHPNLEKFLLTQSPRFDLECLQTLLTSCGTTLNALRLKEIGKLDDKFLQELATLGQDGRTSRLTYLDLSDPSESCSETAMVDLLAIIGSTLTHLNVSNHILLSDTFLSDGLVSTTSCIRTLILNNLPELTDGGVAGFFTSWTDNPPLMHLDLSRNHLLSDDALNAILDHSGGLLEELNLNGWSSLGEEVLSSMGLKVPMLRKIDVGWVREMTDWTVQAWLDGVPQGKGTGHGSAVRMGGCRKLEEVKLWGCNRITMNCPKRKGMSLYGIEAHTVLQNTM